ncbi:UNVERIFIED_CONTAM: hypothetical protein GTU68_023395 [Idotea baltica]|nr:hypothetical protein [Idotea baltica]
MKTLGLIGGTSWHSTIDYYRYLNQIVAERLSPQVNPPLLMYSLNVDLMRRGDWDEIHEAYLNISLKLQGAGAEAIMICANTPHKVCPYVAPKLDIPFIHIADATGSEGKRLGLGKLGLLGTKYVMEEAFISGPLASNHSIQTLVPNKESIEKVHWIIADELTQGVFKEETKQAVIEEMQQLKDDGADGIILGCTELPMLLKPEDFDLPLLDTTYLHAQKAVDFILG